MEKKNWFPDTHQFDLNGNGNWLHSAWIGIYLAIFQLPVLLWLAVIYPVFRALFAGGSILFRFLFLIPLSGFMGRLNTHKMSREEVVMLAIKSGRIG